MDNKIQTTEGNKLIEIFKGERELMPDGQTFGIKRGMPKKYENWYSCISINELQYHSSWDWLMPVVEKIEDLNNKRHHFYIVQNECDIAFDTKYNEDGSDIDAPNFRQSADTKIMAVFQVVVEFIKWYNSQSK